MAISGRGDFPFQSTWFGGGRGRGRGGFLLRPTPIYDSVVKTVFGDFFFEAPPSSLILTVNSAAISLTGTSVNLRLALRLSVSTAAIALTGSNVDLTVTPSAAKIITVESGSIVLTGSSVNLTAAFNQGQITHPPSYGGGAPIWSEVSWFKKKKKPKKEELIEEVAAVVEQAVPQVTEDESRVVALRLVNQISYAQLRQIETLEVFVAKVEAELAEMDDEEVLLLAA